MAPSLRILFAALCKLRDAEPDECDRIRINFVGTSYAPKGEGKKSVCGIAEEFGVADLIEERTDRVGYFDALHTLTEADALLVIGSDSQSYTPSKIYPYVLARRPLLSILHFRSPAAEIVVRCRAGILVTFGEGGGGQEVPTCVDALKRLLAQIELGKIPDIDWQEFSCYTAREMTRRICNVFDNVARSWRGSARCDRAAAVIRNE